MSAVVLGLKVLKNYVYADVVIGYLADQGRVTTTVRASTSDDEIRAAMTPLLDLLTKRAHDSVATAHTSEQIEVRVREELKVVVEAEKQRLVRNNQHAMDGAISAARQAVDYARDEGDKQRSQAVLDRLLNLTEEGK